MTTLDEDAAAERQRQRRKHDQRGGPNTEAFHGMALLFVATVRFGDMSLAG